jgi:hypothetical protein
MDLACINKYNVFPKELDYHVFYTCGLDINKQCCLSGFWIQCFFHPQTRDPRWQKIQICDLG